MQAECSSVGSDDDLDDDDNFCAFSNSTRSGSALLIDVTESTRSAPTCPFTYISSAESEDDDEAEYGAEYAQQTRAALEALLDEADAALFDEPLAIRSSRSHLHECSEWRRISGGFRVRGRAIKAGSFGQISEMNAARGTSNKDMHIHSARDASLETGSEPSDREDECCAHGASNVTNTQHCVIDSALDAQKADLYIAGVGVVPKEANDLAIAAGFAEEIFGAHGVLIEPLATDCANNMNLAVADSTVVNAIAAGQARQRRRHSESWCLRKLGLPPRSPLAAVIDNVTHRLFRRIWHELIPLLSPIVLAIATFMLNDTSYTWPPSSDETSIDDATEGLPPQSGTSRIGPVMDRTFAYGGAGQCGQVADASASSMGTQVADAVSQLVSSRSIAGASHLRQNLSHRAAGINIGTPLTGGTATNLEHDICLPRTIHAGPPGGRSGPAVRRST